MRQLVAELFDPGTTLEYHHATPEDILRAIQLDQKFHGLEIGLVDGVVAAIAERLRIYRVLTIDREDFGPLRVGARFTQQLEIAAPSPGGREIQFDRLGFRRCRPRDHHAGDIARGGRQPSRRARRS